MNYAENLWLFSALLFGIIIVPGMDMLFVMTSALTGGRRTGLAALAGIMLGGAVHTATGLLGATALAVVMPWFSTPLLMAGATYMVWIGFSLLRSTVVVQDVETAARLPLGVTFRRGLFTCLMNPKAYLFIIAVYPQFLRPQYGSLIGQAVIMGLLTITMQAVIYGVAAFAAGWSRTLLVGSRSGTALVGRGAGALLILAALLTAWGGLSHHLSFA